METMPGICITSKVRHKSKWIELRDKDQYPIISTWIDIVDVTDENSKAMKKLWENIMDECTRCAVLIAYVEAGDTLKGGLLEIGAALASGATVYVVGDIPELRTAQYHGHLVKFDNIYIAFQEALDICMDKEVNTGKGHIGNIKNVSPCIDGNKVSVDVWWHAFCSFAQQTNEKILLGFTLKYIRCREEQIGKAISDFGNNFRINYISSYRGVIESVSYTLTFTTPLDKDDFHFFGKNFSQIAELIDECNNDSNEFGKFILSQLNQSIETDLPRRC